MESIIEKVKLLMWEKQEFPAQEYNKEKKEWIKTGGIPVEKTQYTFRDEFGTKLILTGSNEYRNLEAQYVDITIKVEYNDFTRKNSTRLVSIAKSKDQSAF